MLVLCYHYFAWIVTSFRLIKNKSKIRCEKAANLIINIAHCLVTMGPLPSVSHFIELSPKSTALLFEIVAVVFYSRDIQTFPQNSISLVWQKLSQR